MPWTHDQGGWIVGCCRDQAETAEPSDLRSIPDTRLSKCEFAEVNTLGYELLRLSGANRAADLLKIGSNLPGKHLQVSSAEQTCCRSRIGHHVHWQNLAFLISSAPSRELVVWIESGRIKSLAEYKNIRRQISGATDDSVGRVMAASTRVSVGTGKAVPRS